MKQNNRTFRIFLSSTFRDMKRERNALHKNVFSKLKDLCMQHGCRFQIIDLRWGVREEATHDHKTMKICLKEIDRCRKTTPRPNFIILLGDRYGWRPLPAEIPENEFKAILKQPLKPEEIELLNGWYRRDDNAIHHVFDLQPRQGKYTDKEAWKNVETQLRNILLKAVDKIPMTTKAKSKYISSATEQEIIHGAMNVEDAPEHVFCFFRNIKGFSENHRVADYADLDENGRLDAALNKRQAELKKRLSYMLPDNISEFDAKWTGKSCTTDHIDKLCDDVLKRLTKIIQHEIEKIKEIDNLDLEVENHNIFGRERATFFTGRKKTLDNINKYIKTSTVQPLVISGASGSGKTSLIAEAIKQCAAEYKNAEIINRFIGATPDSSDIRSLLESLCRQISRVYDRDEATVPAEYKQLEKDFLSRLSFATAEKPLILFLDALDQLSDAKNARELLWLPDELPEHVSVIVTTLSDDCLEKLKLKIPEKNRLELELMQDKEGRILLDKWLKDAGRTLSAYQKKYILKNFSKDRLPLYLKLAFEEARHWKSYTKKMELSTGISGIIQDMFSRLSSDANHGKIIVSRSMGYLAAARNGLTEDEILDVLSQDREVLEDFKKRAHHKPPEIRLPVIIWSRLFFDLEPYLTERSGDGTTLLAFYHRQLSEVVTKVYLTGKNKKQRHKTLAHYFKNQPCMGEEKGLKSPNIRKVTEQPYHQTFGGLWTDLEKTLTDFSFAMTKSVAEKIDEFDEDYQNALAEMPRPSRELKDWEKFWRTHKHLLLRGNEQWPAYKILLQLAWEYAGKSALTLAAEKWIKEGNCDWQWIRLRKKFRPDDVKKDACIRVLEGHTSGVQFVTLVPNKKMVLTGCEDGSMRLWSLINGRCLRIYVGHKESVRYAFISPDGSKIVSASHDHTVRLWNIESPICQGVMKGHTDIVLKVAMSPDGKHVFSASKDGTVRMWDDKTLTCIRVFKGHNTEVTSVAWLPNTRRIVSSSAKPDNSLHVWDAASGKCLLKITGHKSAIRNIAVSATGEMIASASHDRTVRVWDTKTGKALRVFDKSRNSIEGHTEWVRDVTFTPDAKRIVSVSNDKTVRLWDIKSGKCLKVFEGHSAAVMGVVVTPDGKTALTAATSPDNSVRIWNLSGPQVSDRPVGHLGRIKSFTISPDGNLAATGGGHPEKDARVWDLRSGNCSSHLKQHAGWVTGLAFSPDSKMLVSGSRDGVLRQWQISYDKCLREIKGHKNRITAIKFSSDGEKIVSSGWDEQIIVSDAQTGEQLYMFNDLSDWAHCIDCDGKGHLAAAGMRDGKVQIWNIQNGENRRIINGHKSAIVSVVFSPKENILYSLSQYGTIRSWEIETGKLLADHDQKILYKKEPELFSLMTPSIINKSFLPMPNNVGFSINSSQPIHWCSDQVSEIFLKDNLAILEKIGTINTVRLLDIVSGTRKISLEELEPGKLPCPINLPLFPRLNSEIIMHAFVLLRWIFEGRGDPKDELIGDIMRHFALSYEDRDDILKHVKIASRKKIWKKRQDKLILRSAQRLDQGLKNGLLPTAGRLSQYIETYINQGSGS